MNVDDAGTLEKNGAKIEFGWSGNGDEKGWDAAAGFAPFRNFEAEIGLSRTRDDTESPSGTLHGRGLAFKWVPLQSSTGLSAGLKFEFNRERADSVTRSNSVTGLLTWGFTNTSLVHVNLGQERRRVGGDKEETLIWGVGLDWPLSHALRGTAESFGAEHSGPSHAVGLRYEVVAGVKLSGAMGRGNGTNFGNLGVAWEF